jgi:hypothetical protein
MKTNIKKTLKILTLLISSLLIATVSAQVYRYMYMEGTISVTTAKLVWLEGADIDSTISGDTATFTVTVEQGRTMNFTEALFLKNVNATGSFNYNITITQPLSSSDFTIAKLHIYENSTTVWNYVDTLDLTNTTDFSYGSIDAQEYLRFTLEVEAATASGGTFIIEVKYW